MDQQITVAGNLTREPELRFTTGGKGVCSFAIAVNRRYQQNGEWKDAPPWFVNVSAWDALGENASASLSKGSRVVCTGRMETQSWDDTNGEKKYKDQLVADEIAVSLRWATCTIERVTTSTGGQHGGGDSQPPQHRSPGRPVDPVYGDEEPF